MRSEIATGQSRWYEQYRCSFGGCSKSTLLSFGGWAGGMQFCPKCEWSFAKSAWFIPGMTFCARASCFSLPYRPRALCGWVWFSRDGNCGDVCYKYGNVRGGNVFIYFFWDVVVWRFSQWVVSKMSCQRFL